MDDSRGTTILSRAEVTLLRVGVQEFGLFSKRETERNASIPELFELPRKVLDSIFQALTGPFEIVRIFGTTADVAAGRCYIVGERDGSFYAISENLRADLRSVIPRMASENASVSAALLRMMRDSWLALVFAIGCVADFATAGNGYFLLAGSLIVLFLFNTPVRCYFSQRRIKVAMDELRLL